ncbi:zinc-dependent peptidase, partial [Salmonella enterica]|uniref:zinc-dependent peptidase n=1 Tax=Salmonella enterica TaxID=28901 RepID=UPI00398C6C86
MKWPWKAQEKTQNEDWPSDDALAKPLLENHTAQEQARLIALAERFLQQKRLEALQGFELDSLKRARIALIFCLQILEL